MAFTRKARRIMLILLSILSACILIIVGVLFAYSPGKPMPFLDKNGIKLSNSISEKVFLDINGSKQGMFIKGKNLDNPVILFLHGGIPVYFLTKKYPTHLEDNFTMVWWEQRNCGISYKAESSKSANMLEQLVDDTIVLTKYLLKRFGKEKIYLMAHSGGTFLGVNVIDKAPELYEAYIGIAQMSDQFLSEKMAYEYMLNHFKETHNQKWVNSFESFSFNDQNKIPKEYLKMRDAAMHELGIGTMRSMKNIATDLFLPSLYFSEYTLTEKFYLWYGKSKSGVHQIWEEMTQTNLADIKNDFKIPIYLFHGVYDYTCSYELAKKYFDKINAPIKGFYSFEQSAHSPFLEEPEKMNRILISDIKNLIVNFSDR